MEGHSSHNSNEVADNRAAAISPLPPPPGRAQHDMYIVQFPKDQVYRVPPRENALIIEKHRNPPPAQKRRGCCCLSGCCGCGPRIWLTIALIIISIVAIVGIAIAILYFIFNPTGPTFSVSDVVVKNLGNKNSRPQYEVSLRAKNPNQRMGIDYANGDVWMLFEETKVATGRYPMMEQDRNESSTVKVELTGSNGALPKGMNSGIKSNKTLPLKLEMKLGVRIQAGGLETWTMKANVACEFEVSGLGSDTRVLSQQCDTNFKQY
ncbi:NDR1/HIN1-like protein 13 [Abrus precatorius]|uniref:NDR1/HIN1-like protein 13 n=1 Tax=Abrus precatorius TaxID=3816 RepID=A0A8B8MBI4_ABRPR|nr:NDR1/HIN1-like protein 13 [Abrus precatorius]